ncbi:FAD-dependent oxidoreductase [Phenylobacterium sp. LjRoot219]|uniref:FAD-dependent oxidoreductase n=1 Tax=Phenylobacterium sp. LjRoot219 TaxID=3342283 RepID=UPI003ED17397
MAKAPSIVETRRDQAFPTLSTAEIERLCGFGVIRRYAAGEHLVRAGEADHGMSVILAGEVQIVASDAAGAHPIVVHRAGSFMGELAQLTGRPALVDAVALSPVEAIVLSPEQLRAVLISEAELGERIMRALILRRVGLLETGSGGPILLGHEDDPDLRRLEGFLRRNGHPLHRLDVAVDPEAQALVARFELAESELPIVLCPNGSLLRNPTEGDLARCLGLVSPLDPDRLYDLAVIGAGPAGLAAAVYAASEGLAVLVLDCRAFGGQAGASARIENYLGFPTGISGMALMGRAYNQARKFGAELAIPDEAASLARHPDGGYAIALANAEQARARAVVIAAGARYRRLGVEDLPRYEAASVHYWASPLEARLCAGQHVALVGGGNSAGQAAVYLASQVAKVTMLIRASSLEATMSRYLIDRIASLPNVELVPNAEITGLEGERGVLQTLRWRDRQTKSETAAAIRHLFLFIGAQPNTDWLAGSGVDLDAHGFIGVGNDVGAAHMLETSLPGVYAIGDVRSGSVKRVAAAVGEGAQAVAAVHAFLSRDNAAPPRPVAGP